MTGAQRLKVPEQVLLSGYMQFFQLPVAPEAWLKRGDLSGVDTLWRRWSPDWDPGLYLDNAKHTLAEPGVIKAALGWYRAMFKLWKKDQRKALSWLGQDIATPTQILIGENDGCMSPKLLEHTLVESDFSGGVELQRIANAGHFLHLEQPEVINDHLLRLLNNTRCD